MAGKDNRNLNNNLIFLWLLYFSGIIHWIMFFYFPVLEGNLNQSLYGLQEILFHPSKWFSSRMFFQNEWHHDLSYIKIIQEALQNHTIPFHVKGFNQMFPLIETNRFLAAPNIIMSPLIIFLYWINPFTFIVASVLIMYSVGFYGCILIRKNYNLELVPFIFMFLIYNFNGYFVEKMSAYGSSQLGYFLLPFIILILLKIIKIDSKDYQSQFRLSIWFGIFLAAILYKGSIHIFVPCITFLLIWGAANHKYWRFVFMSLFISFAIGLARLLPSALAFGVQPNPHASIWGGYSSPEQLAKSFVLILGPIDPPAFSWHEWSLYVSLPGLFLLIYFGIWAPFMKDEWRKFRQWPTLILPCIIFFILSVRQWKQYLIPNWIPLLNAESMTSRYMGIPLLIVAVIAAINFQGFLHKYGNVKRVQRMLKTLLLVIALFLATHSFLWRLPIAENQFHVWLTQNEESNKANQAAWKINLEIENETDDFMYIASVWTGISIACISTVSSFGWLWYDRKKRLELLVKNTQPVDKLE